MDSAASYTIAFLFAILVHGIVAALIATNWNQNLIKVADVKPYYIDATVIAENPYTARKDRESDHRKSQRDKKIRQHRLDEADFRKTQARWEEEKTQQKEDPAPQPVIETKPEPEKSVEEPKVDREAVRSSFEEELSFAVIDEKNARKAVTDDEKAMAYVAQIQREIIQNWSRPPSARNGMQAILRVHLVPTGEVVDVKVEETSGNDAFDRSAVLAVTKSERFVVPADAMRFERDFREFTVLFRPDDLRL